jgi:acylphosphatase
MTRGYEPSPTGACSSPSGVEAMALARIELRIVGRVQGVFYRASARDEARALGLSGHARNLDDGAVEIVAEGEEQSLERFLAWCRVGPPAARITRVDVTRAAASGEYTGFYID